LAKTRKGEGEERVIRKKAELFWERSGPRRANVPGHQGKRKKILRGRVNGDGLGLVAGEAKEARAGGKFQKGDKVQRGTVTPESETQDSG